LLRIITASVLIPGGILLIHALRTLGLTMLLASPVLGQSPGNRTYFGQDIYVAAGQQVNNATCFFCSVEVEGSLTGHVTVLFGNLTVSGWVRSNATVLGGNAVVDSQARIGGTTTVLGGNAVYESDDSLSGNAYVLGGHLSKIEAHTSPQRRLSLNPRVFFSLVIGAVLLVGLLLSLPLRRRTAVRQIS